MIEQVKEKIDEHAREKLNQLHFAVAFVGEIALGIVNTVRNPRRIRWRETFYYMGLCGEQSLPVVLLICYLMGLILGFQAAVQMEKFGTQIYVADLVGFAILKELGPLMVAMIATGRAGSAFAAEIGTMIVNEEVSALSTMGISLGRFLVMPKLLALLAVMPVLTVFGDAAGLLGGLTVGVTMLELPFAAYYNETIKALSPAVFIMGVLKSFVFAVIIAYVGCLRGMQSSSDAQGVGRSATSAVVTSIICVVVADALITILYSFIGY